MFGALFRRFLTTSSEAPQEQPQAPLHELPIGVIAGNGPFPIRFVQEARAHGREVVAVCHRGETSEEIAQHVDVLHWVKVGELGKLISAFKSEGVREVAMAGGINRVNHFGDVKLDARGASLMLKLRSTKDDVIMRGIADELAREGIEVISCTTFLSDSLVREGVLTKAKPSDDEREDIRVGVAAIEAMSAQDIGQTVVVRQGVVVAVEAVEGTDAAIRRGGDLGGKGVVVVKFAKPTQDMRFDVPTIGVKTLEVMKESGARVLAVEAGRTLIMDEAEMVAVANKSKITILGCPPLVAAESELSSAESFPAPNV